MVSRSGQAHRGDVLHRNHSRFRRGDRLPLDGGGSRLPLLERIQQLRPQLSTCSRLPRVGQLRHPYPFFHRNTDLASVKVKSLKEVMVRYFSLTSPQAFMCTQITLVLSIR